MTELSLLISHYSADIKMFPETFMTNILSIYNFYVCRSITSFVCEKIGLIMRPNQSIALLSTTPAIASS
jgi:hypothetical protein